MRHRLFTFASLLSLALFLATVVLAGVSFRQPWAYPFPWRGTSYEVALQAGRVTVGNMPEVRAEERRRRESLAELKRGFDYRFERQIFAIQHVAYGPEYVAAKAGMENLRADYAAGQRDIEGRPRPTVVEHSLPLWSVVLTTLSLPAAWIVRGLRRRPRYRRELWTPGGLLAVLLLAASLAISGIWLWSYCGGERWTFTPKAIEPPIDYWAAQSWRVHSWVQLYRGQIQFVSKEIPLQGGPRDDTRPGYEHGGFFISVGGAIPGHAPPPRERSWVVPGATYQALPTSYDGRTMYVGYRSLLLSLWLPVLMCGAFPAVWCWRAFRKSHQRRGNRCRTCGYRLRGNTSGVCPECGTAVPAKA